MHWGVRNNKLKPVLTSEERRKKQIRRSQNIRTGVALIITAAWIASLFSDNSGGSYSKATKMPPLKVKSATDLINERRNVEVASLKRMHKEGKMDAAQAEKFLKILNDRYDRKLAAV